MKHARKLVSIVSMALCLALLFSATAFASGTAEDDITGSSVYPTSYANLFTGDSAQPRSMLCECGGTYRVIYDAWSSWVSTGNTRMCIHHPDGTDLELVHSRIATYTCVKCGRGFTQKQDQSMWECHGW